MPLYPPTTPFGLRLDATAQARAAALVAPVAASWAAYLAAHPEVPPGPPVDEAYVLFGAVTVGLNRWKAPPLWHSNFLGTPEDVPADASFVPGPGTGVATLTVSVANTDVVRATAIIDGLISAPTFVSVLGRACCTGLAYLSGVSVDQGPFS